MADETYVENLLRWAAAHVQLQTRMQAAQEMFGKGYFALGVGEQTAVDRTVFDLAVSNYKAMTMENLVALTAAEKPAGTVGFVDHSQEKTKSSQ